MVDERRHSTRRQFLLTAGAATAAGSAGCLGGGGASTTIALLAAGSLQNALSNGLEPAVDVPVRTEAHGSAAVARMIAEGQRDPDIVSVADVALFGDPLSPSWYSVFASNSIVVAYNPDTDGGQQLAEAGPGNWYEPMVEGNVDIGRTDPDQDPLGYRALFTFELASRYYDDAPALRAQLPQRNQLYPETSLLSQFETGGIDAAIAYRNMAVERGYEFVELPDQIDLSNPEYAEDWYATTSYTLPSGREVRGAPISYGSTLRHVTDAALSVFDVHTTGSHLDDHGFLLRDQFPAYAGEVPRRVSQSIAQSGESRSRPASPGTQLSPAVSEITLLI